MAPELPVYDLCSMTDADAEAMRDGRFSGAPGVPQCACFTDHVIGEFCVALLLSDGLALLADHVSFVVGLCPEEQVTGPHADGTVAMMEYVQIIGDRSEMDDPRSTVGALWQIGSGGRSEVTVSPGSNRPDPIPAIGIHDGDLLPEQHDRIFRSLTKPAGLTSVRAEHTSSNVRRYALDGSVASFTYHADSELHALEQTFTTAESGSPDGGVPRVKSSGAVFARANDVKTPASIRGHRVLQSLGAGPDCCATNVGASCVNYTISTVERAA